MIVGLKFLKVLFQMTYTLTFPPFFSETIYYGTGGAAFGFVYAKFADSPVEALAISFAIWRIFEQTILNVVKKRTKKIHDQKIYETYVIVLSGSVGNYLLYSQGLIGKKMVLFISLIKVLVVLAKLDGLY